MILRGCYSLIVVWYYSLLSALFSHYRPSVCGSAVLEPRVTVGVCWIYIRVSFCEVGHSYTVYSGYTVSVPLLPLLPWSSWSVNFITITTSLLHKHYCYIKPPVRLKALLLQYAVIEHHHELRVPTQA
jgi:hypothetical protein